MDLGEVCVSIAAAQIARLQRMHAQILFRFAERGPVIPRRDAGLFFSKIYGAGNVPVRSPARDERLRGKQNGPTVLRKKNAGSSMPTMASEHLWCRNCRERPPLIIGRYTDK